MENNTAHHEITTAGKRSREQPPAPGPERPAWRARLERLLGEDPEIRWGARLVRIANDMILVCDEDFRILHHNLAFTKAVGYQAGSFAGCQLLDFLPAAGREDAEKALEDLQRGRVEGMRLGAHFLTRRGLRWFDARFVRSRLRSGRRLHYGILREEPEPSAGAPACGDGASLRIFGDLPVAVWRTDSHLRVLAAEGALWSALHIDPGTLPGTDLADRRKIDAPPFLMEIDYSDVMAGLTLHIDLSWRGESFEATVEPFLDENQAVAGTVGLLRRSKRVARPAAAARAAGAAGDATRAVPLESGGGGGGRDRIALAN